MNRGNRTFKKPLPPCPNCKTYNGMRMATTGATELYAVKCARCGAITRLCKTQSAATSAWVKGAVRTK